MGWAEVVHPFHPYRGQRFAVLKTRRVAGIETLILRHPERGSYAVARAWTDRGDPIASDLPGVVVAKLDAEFLLQLATFLAQLDQARVIDQ